MKVYTALLSLAAVLCSTAYWWVIRCTCPRCYCGWGCGCPKYWTPVEMIALAILITLVGATVFLAARRGWRANFRLS